MKSAIAIPEQDRDCVQIAAGFTRPTPGSNGKVRLPITVKISDRGRGNSTDKRCDRYRGLKCAVTIPQEHRNIISNTAVDDDQIFRSAVTAHPTGNYLIGTRSSGIIGRSLKTSLTVSKINRDGIGRIAAAIRAGKSRNRDIRNAITVKVSLSHRKNACVANLIARDRE